MKRRARRLLETASSRLPGSSGVFGPPRHRITIAGLALRGYEYRRAFSGYTPDWSSIEDDSGAPIQFLSRLPEYLPEAGVITLPRGRVLGQDGWPLTRGDELVVDSAFIHENWDFQRFRRVRGKARITHLSGKALVLGTAFSDMNFAHALLDGIGRLAIVDGAGLDLRSVDHIIVPGFTSPSFNQVLNLAGVAEKRIVRLRAESHFMADELLITSFPGLPRIYPIWLGSFMRRFVSPREAPGPRLFVARAGGRRAIRNLAEVNSLIREHGFDVVDPGLADDVIDRFGNTPVILGSHGAGLANAVFAASGTYLIELLPSGHRYPYYASLAASSGLRYVGVDCPSVSATPHADFTVDVGRLDRLLSRIRV